MDKIKRVHACIEVDAIDSLKFLLSCNLNVRNQTNIYLLTCNTVNDPVYSLYCVYKYVRIWGLYFYVYYYLPTTGLSIEAFHFHRSITSGLNREVFNERQTSAESCSRCVG